MVKEGRCGNTKSEEVYANNTAQWRNKKLIGLRDLEAIGDLNKHHDRCEKKA